MSGLTASLGRTPEGYSEVQTCAHSSGKTEPNACQRDVNQDGVIPNTWHLFETAASARFFALYTRLDTLAAHQRGATELGGIWTHRPYVRRVCHRRTGVISQAEEGSYGVWMRNFSFWMVLTEWQSSGVAAVRCETRQAGPIPEGLITSTSLWPTSISDNGGMHKRLCSRTSHRDLFHERQT